MNKMSEDTFKELVEEFDLHTKKFEQDLTSVEITPCDVQDTIKTKA